MSEPKPCRLALIRKNRLKNIISCEKKTFEKKNFCWSAFPLSFYL